MSDPKTWPKDVRVTVATQPSWNPLKSVPYLAALCGLCAALVVWRSFNKQ